MAENLPAFCWLASGPEYRTRGYLIRPAPRSLASCTSRPPRAPPSRPPRAPPLAAAS
jgi:hypothetical protein